MTNREKLTFMYEYALGHAYCHNRKTFAAFIGINANNLSNAFSDSLHERYCTNGLLNKANAALGYVFSQQWIQDGIGDMYAQSAEATDTTPLPSATTAEDSSDIDYRMRCTELERVIEALNGTIESQKGTIKSQERIIEMLERENEDLKKENYYVSVRAKNA